MLGYQNSKIAQQEVAQAVFGGIALSGKLVTLTGYVDSANIFDTRINENRNSFALIPDFEKIGENTVFVEFAHKTDAFAILDELHAKPYDFELTAVVSGELHSFEMPMNFNTATGYELLVFDLADIIFYPQMRYRKKV